MTNVKAKQKEQAEQDFVQVDLHPVVCMMYPELNAFCNTYAYTIPSLEFFKDNIKYNLRSALGTSAANHTILGKYNSYNKQVSIAYTDQPIIKMVKVLIHELGHVIQHFNLGAYWMHTYDHQTELSNYANNMFEVQANFAIELLEKLPEDILQDIAAKLECILNEQLTKALLNKIKLGSFLKDFRADRKRITKQSKENLYIRKNRKFTERLHATRFGNTNR